VTDHLQRIADVGSVTVSTDPITTPK